MTCKHAASGCNYPESECAGLCMHRVSSIPVQLVEHARPSHDSLGHKVLNVVMAWLLAGLVAYVAWGGR
jgi:hypothetical protein